MPSKIKSQPKNPQELQQWLEGQGIKVRPQSEWGQTLRRLQNQANATGQTHSVQISIPVRPQVSYSDRVRSGGGEYNAPANLPANRPTNNRGGPGPGYTPDNPYMSRPHGVGPVARGYHFPSPQPALPAAEATQLRNQYAQATSQGGNFTTGANQGLLDLLQGAGIRPTPLNQWAQYLQSMKR